MNRKKLLSGFTIFLVISQLFFPYSIRGEVDTANLESVINRYEVIQDIVLDTGLTIEKNTYLYGEEHGQSTNLQYGDSIISVDSDVLQLIEIDSQDEYPNFENYVTNNNLTLLKQGTILYANEDFSDPTLRVNKDIYYDVYTSANGNQAIILGNVSFYLNDVETDDNEETHNKNTEQELNEIEMSDSISNEIISNSPLLDSENSSVNDESTQPNEESIQEVNVLKTMAYTTRSINTWSNSNSKYFRVTQDNLVIYDNRSGALKPIGALEAGQVYPRVSDYGNWHRIQFGNIYGYVAKTGTIPDDGESIKNENSSYKNQERTFNGLVDLVVYDNSSGNLVPFGKINQGQSYTIVSDYGNWLRVLFSDRVGYVSKSDLKINFTASDKYFKVTEENLVIYDNRGGTLKPIGNLEAGQVYPRVSDYGNWHRIQFGNIYGYVAKADTVPDDGKSIKNENSSYKNQERTFNGLVDLEVYDNSSGSLVPFGKINQGQTYSIVSDYGNWLRVLFSDRVGYVSKSDLKINFAPSDKYFKVVVENSVIYDNRGGTLKPIGMLEAGQVYPRVSDYGNWHRIQYGNIYGYVAKADTILDDGKSIRNKNSSYKNQEQTFNALVDLIVYDNSSGSIVPFGKINQGQTYPIVSDYGNWWKIIFADRIGFIKKEDVQSNLTVIVPTLQVYSSFDDLANYTRQQEVSTLYYGDTVEVLEEYSYAIKVRYGNNLTGWVHKGKLGFYNDNPWYVKTEKNIRSSASASSENIGFVDAGTDVIVLDYIYYNTGTYKDWFKIRTANNLEGWIWGGGSPGYNLVRYEAEYYNGIVNQIGLFTPLNSKSTITAEQINRFIASRTNSSSYMYNMGDAFIEAQNKTGLNAVYLVAHAALETGFGTSSIVKNKYNYFGIGAFDACPSECANEFEGKRAGIINGADWISKNYVYRDAYKQFTVYNMRYNNNTHQYATDEAWDVKIINIANQMVQFLGIK